MDQGVRTQDLRQVFRDPVHRPDDGAANRLVTQVAQPRHHRADGGGGGPLRALTDFPHARLGLGNRQLLGHVIDRSDLELLQIAAVGVRAGRLPRRLAGFD